MAQVGDVRQALSDDGLGVLHDHGLIPYRPSLESEQPRIGGMDIGVNSKDLVVPEVDPILEKSYLSDTLGKLVLVLDSEVRWVNEMIY